MDVELDDWEVLDDSNSPRNTTYLAEIEQDTQQIITSDYFSLQSDIDPVSDTNYYSTTKPIREFSSDDGRCVSSDNELGEFDIASRQVACDESLSDSGEIEERSGDEEMVIVEARNRKSIDNDNDGEERNKAAVVVWWKLPLDLLKYCLFKASPLWTLSAAAAMMGVVILGRRLYKMKQKARILQLKVTLDDKKVSQVMSRAARLNEAFSVVKQAPIIRPSLPAAGNAHWPMIALR
ncbi:hypothetical protein QVD17_07233 [Tagetes erecta]|uniref:DUF6821 domain-containing protein n=1 Tax=Tagetes erecta TaxID=13708 RepID=A0AAD8LL04_TARER|nr:hypothetical protein QVD17_07233 [Tagetes erecta]